MVVASKKLILEVMGLARIALVNLGFKKRGGGEIYTYELSKNVIGWLGLQRSVHRGDGLLEIVPQIGARNQEVEKMLAEVRGEKFHSYIPPTVGTPIGYLMPENDYITWLFQEGDEKNREKVDDMVSAIMKYGKPFMEANVPLEALISSMIKGYGYPFVHAYRLPIAYFILGDIMKAKKYLAKELKAIGDRKDPAAENYRKFARNFSKRLEQAR